MSISLQLLATVPSASPLRNRSWARFVHRPLALVAGLIMVTTALRATDYIVSPTDYIVSPTGNATTGNGTLAAPFATVAHALTLAQAGDTVNLRAGTYRETIAPPRSGTAGSPITIQNYNGEQVVVSACDVVSGNWTSTGNGIYTAPTAGALPLSFWSPPGASAAGSQFIESNGSLVGTLINETGSTTKTLTSPASAVWNFFSQAVTWKVRGLSIANSGTTALPTANGNVWLSVMSGVPTTGAAASNAYVADDAVTVVYGLAGTLKLTLKTNGGATTLGTVPTGGTVTGTSTTDITGYDLTLGPASGSNVPYSFTVYKSSGNVTTTGNWAITQADWTYASDNTKSALQVFGQESLSATTDNTQKFTFTVGSYTVTAGATAILTDEFDDGDPASVNAFPSGASAQTVSTGSNQVFVDGVMQQEARFPNYGAGDIFHPATADLTVYSSNSTLAGANVNTVTSASFGGQATDYFLNARFYGGVGSLWSWQNGVVTASSGNALTIGGTIGSTTKSQPWWPDADSVASATGTGFVYGLLSLLDADGEWYYAPGTSTLHLRMTGAADPTSHVVELKRRNWCVNINGVNYITVKGLKTVGGAIQLKGTGNVLTHCDASYLSHFLSYSNGYNKNGGTTQGGGVVLAGTGNTVQYSTLHETAGPAIYSTGTGHLITRNTLYNGNYAGIFTGLVALMGIGETVTYNTIYDGGRDIITCQGTGQTVMFNDLSGSGHLCHDHGTIYNANNNSKGAGSKGTRIAYNWIHDNAYNTSYVAGIYLDNYDRFYQLDHNVIWNITSTTTWLKCGIYLNAPADGQLLYHNTTYNCGTYNTNTYNKYPTGNPDPAYWTDTNQHLIYTAQNNLILTTTGNAAVHLEDITTNDFRPKLGSLAINPTLTTGSTSWTSPSLKVNIPSNFSLNRGDWGGNFTYTETTGQGVTVTGVNGWAIDTQPDSGAYERGIAAWIPGVTGWEGIKCDIPPALGTTTATLQGVRVSLDTTTSTQIRVYYGPSDGGNTTVGWANAADLGTAVPTDVISVFQHAVTGLSNGTNYYARFRATNANGDTWSDVQPFTTISTTPTITTAPTAASILFGQTLASATLSGGAASVPGTFAFTSPTTVPGVGTTSFSVTFTPTDLVNYTTASTTANVTVSGTILSLWADGYGLTGNAALPAADPDSDGSGNLLEYAFGTSPVAISDQYRPTVRVYTVAAQSYLEITYQQNLDATDLTYAVQQSSDLVNWTTLTPAGGDVTITPIGGTRLRTVAVRTALTGTRQFLRIGVTKN